MKPEKIILMTPTHEQSTPSFHVEENLAEDFLKFLKSQGLEAWQPPEKFEKQGPDHRPIVEIRLEAGTPLQQLETLADKFMAEPQREKVR